MKFIKKLKKAIDKNDSLVCVGLDTDLEKIPKHLLKKREPIFQFNKAIINATHDLVCAYKPNIAFYEAEGIEGLKSLKKTIEYLQKNYPEIPIILDMKRSDIGNTSERYAKAAFEYWQVDAITAYPYLGYDAVEPFLRYKDKYIFFLVHTSNPDAKILQEVKIKRKPYYLLVAEEIKKWHKPSAGIFMAATFPEQMKKVREIFPDKVFLTAGIGAQKADAGLAVKSGVNQAGNGLICNSSRSIIYASEKKRFRQESPRKNKRIKKLHQSIPTQHE